MAAMKKDDLAIRHDVLSELDWDPRFDSRNIGVAVKHGVVALTGHVSSYAERRAAEEATQAVAGVTALANDIIIELGYEATRTDAEIAEAAVVALKDNISVPVNDIKLVVREGWATLSGEVAMWYQKNAAQTALAYLRGLKGITNNITIRAFVSASEVKGRIQDAIRRRAQTDAQNIEVKAANGAVTLEGQVSSWAERQQAEMAAWQAPGVSKVIDNLSVRP
jgi:osmotically-inducible protein OsmY